MDFIHFFIKFINFLIFLELLDPAIRLLVELKGPKSGSFSVECELDVTIGEMKSQILEILEKNLGKPFLSQEKLFKIMINHPEKGIIVLNDSQTIDNYKLKNNQTITVRMINKNIKFFFKNWSKLLKIAIKI